MLSQITFSPLEPLEVDVFLSLKIHRSQPGLKPLTSGLEAITSRDRGRLCPY